ncbi:MAG TPA: hypothetical protein VMZ69_05390 [Saprospiraceae bacterium]|nr:hypothetical protein [Saprospiraceae bacterium]
MKFYFPISIFCIMLFASCIPRLTYFTQNLNEKQNWSQEDLKRIQFYVSHDIVLSRTISDDDTKITEGKIRIINGRKVQQIVIKERTPGVLILMPKEDRFAISFEEEDDAFLMFGPNPKYYERFALLAQDWEEDNGQVHYKGQLYHVDNSSAYSALMVDLKREGENQYVTKRVQGRTVKGS